MRRVALAVVLALLLGISAPAFAQESFTLRARANTGWSQGFKKFAIVVADGSDGVEYKLKGKYSLNTGTNFPAERTKHGFKVTANNPKTGKLEPYEYEIIGTGDPGSLDANLGR